MRKGGLSLSRKKSALPLIKLATFQAASLLNLPLFSSVYQKISNSHHSWGPYYEFSPRRMSFSQQYIRFPYSLLVICIFNWRCSFSHFIILLKNGSHWFTGSFHSAFQYFKNLFTKFRNIYLWVSYIHFLPKKLSMLKCTWGFFIFVWRYLEPC